MKNIGAALSNAKLITTRKWITTRSLAIVGTFHDGSLARKQRMPIEKIQSRDLEQSNVLVIS